MLEQACDQDVAGEAFRLGLVAGHQAVAQHVRSDGLDVLRGDEAATLEEGLGPGAGRQPQGRARAGRDLDHPRQAADAGELGIARGSHQADAVILQAVIHVHAGERGLGLAQRLGGQHRHHLGEVAGHGAVEDLPLLDRRGVVDADLRHEAVGLGLGQRIGAFLLDRILGREHEERPGQGEGLVADGDLALLHRLEQRRLDLGRGAVDLVGEHHLGEDRPLAGGELPAGVDARADDVGRAAGRG